MTLRDKLTSPRADVRRQAKLQMQTNAKLYAELKSQEPNAWWIEQPRKKKAA